MTAALVVTAISLLLTLPATTQEFPRDGNLADLERWYHHRVRQSIIRNEENARRRARGWQDYLDRLQQEREAREAQAHQRRDEQRRREEERQARLQQQEAERQAQREAEAQRIAQFQAEQRALALRRQAERAAEWQRWKEQVSERLTPILSVLVTFTLWFALPLTFLVVSLWWFSTMAHRYRLHRVNREIERTRASTRRFDDVAADLKRAKAEADAFIAREARTAYQRGRGL
jgi:hypothetical protein